jgi:osmotically-inducible protein OsmY
MRQQIADRGGSNWNGPVDGICGDHGVAAPTGDPQLADKVRTRLGEDPRTTDLPSLNINVVDGTVVVRGSLPDDADETAVRDVVAGVDGVRDVEMELGPASR